MVLNTRTRIVVGLGVFLGLLSIFYILVYEPQIEHRRALDVEISRQSVKLAKLEKKSQELEKLKEERKKILQDLSFLEEKLKETQASFLYELGMRGKVYGIEYVSIIPLATVEEKYYSRTPVNIHLYGKYHNLGMLLSDMARRGGLGSFTVDSVLIKASSKKEYTIEANLSLSLYNYRKKYAPAEKNITSSLKLVSSKTPDRRKR